MGLCLKNLTCRLLHPDKLNMFFARTNNASTPGIDKICYSYLKKLPCCHHFLATLFSKILFVDHHSPDSWCKAEIKLIHKGEDTNCPSNFRPIASVGKLFHKILAIQLEKYLFSNNIIDSKGFLTGISGVLEHIL